MTTRKLRRARIVLLALTLGFVFAGLALAEKAPLCAERPSGKCASRMTLAQPGLNPAAPAPAVALAVSGGSTQSACFWAWYEEYWKDNDICRWYKQLYRPALGLLPERLRLAISRDLPLLLRKGPGVPPMPRICRRDASAPRKARRSSFLAQQSENQEVGRHYKHISTARS